jgi:hypothetical protein
MFFRVLVRILAVAAMLFSAVLCLCALVNIAPTLEYFQQTGTNYLLNILLPLLVALVLFGLGSLVLVATLAHDPGRDRKKVLEASNLKSRFLRWYTRLLAWLGVPPPETPDATRSISADMSRIVNRRPLATAIVLAVVVTLLVYGPSIIAMFRVVLICH